MANKQTTVRFDPETNEGINKYGAEHGLNKTDVIKKAVETFLKNNEEEATEIAKKSISETIDEKLKEEVKYFVDIKTPEEQKAYLDERESVYNSQTEVLKVFYKRQKAKNPDTLGE